MNVSPVTGYSVLEIGNPVYWGHGNPLIHDLMDALEFRYRESAGVEATVVSGKLQTLESYTEKLRAVVENLDYEADEASLVLPSDTTISEQVRLVVERKKNDQLKYIVVVGIGGSNLGTYAIYQALFGVEDAFIADRLPKILFADTVSAALIQSLRTILEQAQSAEEIVVNIISKSGTTTETVANFELLHACLSEHFTDIDDRIVVTTDEGSRLWQMATEKHLDILTLPKRVGGRYSVFSAVGLFPLALTGIDTEALLEGARTMRGRCLSGGSTDNIAAISAVLQAVQAEAGLTVNNTFFFNPELEMLGKWYRQLMGESLGKEKNRGGVVGHRGITPIVSIGSTDLHSMVQLYFGGPRDKFTYFVSAPQVGTVRMPEAGYFPGLVAGIAGRSVAEIMSAIQQSVEITYGNHQLPYVEVALSEISEYVLGQYLQFRMLEMMYLAELLDVNAFDQPNVEDYKAEMRKLLV